MNVQQLGVWTLLGVGVFVALLCAVGVLLMRDAYERLHYLAPISSVSVMAIAIAILLQEALSQAGIKSIIVALILVLMNSVLTHATARAARVREFGGLDVRPAEEKGAAEKSEAAGR